MHMLARADRFACKLGTTVGYNFICVRVCAGAGAGLKNVEGKMVVQFSVHNLFSGLHDQRGTLGIEQPEIMIRLRSRPFDQTQGTDEWSRKSIAAHRKIQHRPVSGGAMKRI